MAMTSNKSLNSRKIYYKNNISRHIKITSATAILLTATGCQTTQSGGNIIKDNFASEDPCSNNSRNIGIAVGVVGGTILGKVLGGDKTGMVVGAAVGGLLGGLIGNDIDRRRCDLYKIAKQHQIDMQVDDINEVQADKNSSKKGMSVSVRDNSEQFAVGSAKLTSSGTEAFKAIAQSYMPSPDPKNAAATRERTQKMRILLVGHTDDTGSSAQNAQLSEARARAVAEIFASQGFDRSQIFYQGAGETLPVANNIDEAGRTRNRRVEILDLSDDTAFDNYLSGGRRTNTAFYREATPEQQKTVSTNTAKPRAAGKAQADKNSVQKAVTVPSSTTSAHPHIIAPSAHAAPAVTLVTPSAPARTAPAPEVSITRTSIKPGAVDFGGTPVNGRPAALALGGTAPTSTFSIISTAQADEAAGLLSCLQDRPRVARGVKSLRTDKLRTTDYLPGVYDSSWVASVNGHLLALNHVAVLRDGAVPARNPDLLVYRDYQGDAKARADFTSKPEVNAYMGKNGLLYRVFSAGPVQCMDILIPHQKATTASSGNLIYPGQGDYFQKDFSPRLAK